MKKLYTKKPLLFALALIGIYVAGMSGLEAIAPLLGGAYAPAAGALAASVLLLFWLKRNNLMKPLGLCGGNTPAKAFLWYVPLAVISLYNLWNGAQRNWDLPETAFFMVKMLCVGFLEELIFRGFLFRALKTEGIGWAVAVSSITFGLGHIVNLFNGSAMALADNLVQIVSATAIGFLYVLMFHRGGTLLPGILSHGVFNALNAFGRAETPAGRSLLLILVVGYSLVLLRTLPKKT